MATVARGHRSRARAKDAELDSLLENLKEDERRVQVPRRRRLPRRRSRRRRNRLRTDRDPATEIEGRRGAKQGDGQVRLGGSRRRGQAGGQSAGSRDAWRPRTRRSTICWASWGRARTSRRRKSGRENRGPAAARRPKGTAGGEKERAKLGGKDKEIDDRLEELAGRKRKRPHADDEERSGPIGEMIKEMRDVEKRLGKPDSGEDTQAKQKQIIKRIDTLIEQVRQSGSSAGRLTIRRRRRQGNQPGQQEGDQTGALAQGARAMKPAKPTSQHSTAGGKGVWGHLPEELRQIMDNTLQGGAADSKAELISRYFLSVGKGKLVREE